MDRRNFLRAVAATGSFLAGLLLLRRPIPIAQVQRKPVSRVRPGKPGWPSEADWEELRRQVGGRLVEVRSPLADCVGNASDPACGALFKKLKNPYFIGDEPGLTQTLGWAEAWTSRPSVYAVAAATTEDVVAAVSFAREHNLRIVVKGGGHSYKGTSNAPDSLLVWTRRMNAITVHDAFLLAGCEGQAPQPAVTIGAGAMWGAVYYAVTTGTGRYVQGGGCLTVGVPGLVLGGGFGSHSKAFGTAAASLLEAEVVTADGAVRIANACRNPDLFWALKGGGGGNLGIVTRLTLKTHDLPATIGAVFGAIRASSDNAFRRLIAEIIRFYREALFNPTWGEQIRFQPNNVLGLSMLFLGLDQGEAEAVWNPFFDWVRAAPQDFSFEADPVIMAAPARQFWDPEFLKQLPGLVQTDGRPGAADGNIFWTSNRGEAGQILHAYQSAWIPASLLEDGQREALADALFAASRHWSVTLHTNKGLAGAPEEAIAATRDTATNPAVLDAFALLISASAGDPAYPGIAGREPDLAVARHEAERIRSAMAEMRNVAPGTGAYVSESDFFEENWQAAYWGENYERLLAVKEKYDPDGLFFVHHGPGSERWSPDGFTRRS